MFAFQNSVTVELPLEGALVAFRAYQERMRGTYSFVEDPHHPGRFTGERRADWSKHSGHAVHVTTLTARQDGRTEAVTDAVITGPLGLRFLKRPVSWKLNKLTCKWAELLLAWYDAARAEQTTDEKQKEAIGFAHKVFAEVTRLQQAALDAVEVPAREKRDNTIVVARANNPPRYSSAGHELPPASKEAEDVAWAEWRETVYPAQDEFEKTTQEEKKVLATALAKIEREYS